MIGTANARALQILRSEYTPFSPHPIESSSEIMITDYDRGKLLRGLP